MSKAKLLMFFSLAARVRFGSSLSLHTAKNLEWKGVDWVYQFIIRNNKVMKDG